jgi:energy-converting hydrogenase Eha subunit E
MGVQPLLKQADKDQRRFGPQVAENSVVKLTLHIPVVGDWLVFVLYQRCFAYSLLSSFVSLPWKITLLHVHILAETEYFNINLIQPQIEVLIFLPVEIVV